MRGLITTESLIQKGKTMKTLNISIVQGAEKFGCEPYVSVLSFQYDESKVANPMDNVRAAIKEFCENSDDAKEMLDYANGVPNWGDIMSVMTDAYFCKHGVIPMSDECCDVVVDHDEVLYYKESD